MAKSADAFRTISEVAEWLDTPAHVLRFWESRFSQVKPVKRAGGRRYYRPGDMLLLGGIKKLLHEDGMTIKGAQKLLRTDGVKSISALSQPLDMDDQTVIDLLAQTPGADDAEPVEAVVETTVPQVSVEVPPALSIVTAEQTTPEQQADPTPDPEPVPEVEPQPAVEPAVAPELEPLPEIEPEAPPEIAPEIAPEPLPETQPFPEQDPEPIPELAPRTERDSIPEPAPGLPPVSEPPAPAADLGPAPAPQDAAANNDAETEQLSSIYSRLGSLHDRLKASIDPKQQG